MKILQNRLAEIRRKRNLTQTQLAEMVDMTRRQIINIENGDSGISTLSALLIADALGVKVGDIFYFEYSGEAEKNSDGEMTYV